MNIRGVLLCSSLAASTWAVLSSQASAASDLCAAEAVGVPTRPGPPKWLSWASGDVVDPNIDDPRWLTATGKNFQFTASGGAIAPVETKALWANEGGQQFLYLSFLINVTPASTGSTTTPRDLYLGFRPPTPFSPYAGDTENAYIFQFHLNSTTTTGPTDLVAPTRCDTDSICGELGSSPGNFWRVFVDHDDSSSVSCNDVTGTPVNGTQFTLLAPDPAHPEADPPAWVDNAVRYWKLDATPSFPLLKNQWAVQIRIPVVAPGPTANIRQGVVQGSQIWYELTADVGTTNRTSIAMWPRDLTSHVCQRRAFGSLSLIHPQLGTVANWSALTTFSSGGAVPSDCAGLSVDMQNIGSVFNPPGGTDFTNATLGTEIKGYLPDGTPKPNEIVARVRNTSGAAITAPLIARFRLANWGAQPFWMTGDRGKFNDIRGAQNGVCAAGDAPNCTAVTAAANGNCTHAGDCPAMHFTWQLGTGTAINGAAEDASEYCQYQITPPGVGASCAPCNCATDPQAACEATTDQGTRAVIPGSTTAFKCVSAHFEHECMMVEVDAPSSAVDFVSRSNWNNMEFRGTSTMAQTATIDVRGLPKQPGQLYQDVYLVVMPRNMPASTGAPITGVDLIRQKTDQQINALIRPYAEDYARMSGAEREAVLAKTKRHGLVVRVPGIGGNGYGGSGYGSGSDGGPINRRKPNETEQRLMQLAQYLSDDDFAKAQALLDVALVPDGPKQAEAATHVAVDELGPQAAADIVPTLDIYAFYRVDPEAVKTGALYLPMTSFSVFLFHNATPLTGLRWEIDGFRKVGENIFEQKIPVDRVRKIQVRAQSIEPGEPAIPRGNANWPCAGCCGGPRCGTYAGISNMAPGLIAGVFVWRRRKRKPRAAPVN